MFILIQENMLLNTKNVWHSNQTKISRTYCQHFWIQGKGQRMITMIWFELGPGQFCTRGNNHLIKVSIVIDQSCVKWFLYNWHYDHCAEAVCSWIIDRHLPFLVLKFQIVQKWPPSFPFWFFDQVDRIRITVLAKYLPLFNLRWKKAQWSYTWW